MPKIELRGAMNDVRNNWDELLTYVSDGRVPLDNNVAEQLMKQVAVGRKHLLFAGSLAGGYRVARLLSVVPSAWRSKLDLERYLTDLLKQLLHGCCDYESLLPHVWLAAHPDAVREYRKDERRDVEEHQRERREARRRRHPATADDSRTRDRNPAPSQSQDRSRPPRPRELPSLVRRGRPPAPLRRSSRSPRSH